MKGKRLELRLQLLSGESSNVQSHCLHGGTHLLSIWKPQKRFWTHWVSLDKQKKTGWVGYIFQQEYFFLWPPSQNLATLKHLEIHLDFPHFRRRDMGGKLYPPQNPVLA